MSSSEKRDELALAKRRHEELERQYQVSIKLKEQENRLKFEQSQLQLEQLAESHKKQLIEMEMKAFELEDSSSEVSEKVAESKSTGVRVVRKLHRRAPVNPYFYLLEKLSIERREKHDQT